MLIVTCSMKNERKVIFVETDNHSFTSSLACPFEEFRGHEEFAQTA